MKAPGTSYGRNHKVPPFGACDEDIIIGLTIERHKIKGTVHQVGPGGPVLVRLKSRGWVGQMPP